MWYRVLTVVAFPLLFIFPSYATRLPIPNQKVEGTSETAANGTPEATSFVKRNGPLGPYVYHQGPPTRHCDSDYFNPLRWHESGAGEAYLNFTVSVDKNSWEWRSKTNEAKFFATHAIGWTDLDCAIGFKGCIYLPTCDEIYTRVEDKETARQIYFILLSFHHINYIFGTIREQSLPAQVAILAMADSMAREFIWKSSYTLQAKCQGEAMIYKSLISAGQALISMAIPMAIPAMGAMSTAAGIALDIVGTLSGTATSVAVEGIKLAQLDGRAKPVLSGYPGGGSPGARGHPWKHILKKHRENKKIAEYKKTHPQAAIAEEADLYAQEQAAPVENGWNSQQQVASVANDPNIQQPVAPAMNDPNSQQHAAAVVNDPNIQQQAPTTDGPNSQQQAAPAVNDPKDQQQAAPAGIRTLNRREFRWRLERGKENRPPWQRGPAYDRFWEPEGISAGPPPVQTAAPEAITSDRPSVDDLFEEMPQDEWRDWLAVSTPRAPQSPRTGSSESPPTGNSERPPTENRGTGNRGTGNGGTGNREAGSRGAEGSDRGVLEAEFWNLIDPDLINAAAGLGEGMVDMGMVSRSLARFDALNWNARNRGEINGAVGLGDDMVDMERVNRVLADLDALNWNARNRGERNGNFEKRDRSSDEFSHSGAITPLPNPTLNSQSGAMVPAHPIFRYYSADGKPRLVENGPFLGKDFWRKGGIRWFNDYRNNDKVRHGRSNRAGQRSGIAFWVATSFIMPLAGHKLDQHVCNKYPIAGGGNEQQFARNLQMMSTDIGMSFRKALDSQLTMINRGVGLGYRGSFPPDSPTLLAVEIATGRWVDFSHQEHMRFIDQPSLIEAQVTHYFKNVAFSEILKNGKCFLHCTDKEPEENVNHLYEVRNGTYCQPKCWRDWKRGKTMKLYGLEQLQIRGNKWGIVLEDYVGASFEHWAAFRYNLDKENLYPTFQEMIDGTATTSTGAYLPVCYSAVIKPHFITDNPDMWRIHNSGDENIPCLCGDSYGNETGIFFEEATLNQWIANRDGRAMSEACQLSFSHERAPPVETYLTICKSGWHWPVRGNKKQGIKNEHHRMYKGKDLYCDAVNEETDAIIANGGDPKKVNCEICYRSEVGRKIRSRQRSFIRHKKSTTNKEIDRWNFETACKDFNEANGYSC